MNAWTLVLKSQINQRVDASSIRLASWPDMSVGDVERVPLQLGHDQVRLADRGNRLQLGQIGWPLREA